MPQHEERRDLIPDTPTARLLKGAGGSPGPLPISAADCKPQYTMPEPTPGGPAPNCQPAKYVTAPEPTPGGPPPNCQPKRYIEAPDTQPQRGKNLAQMPPWATALGDDLAETFR
jgi:hypothetical protein